MILGSRGLIDSLVVGHSSFLGFGLCMSMPRRTSKREIKIPYRSPLFWSKMLCLTYAVNESLRWKKTVSVPHFERENLSVQ
jgi:hypothetical protein